MLANSNLSIIPSKSSANISNTGGGSAANTESFDAVFQQANDSLSGESSSSVTVNDENIKLVPLDGFVAVTDDAPVLSSATAVTDDTPVILATAATAATAATGVTDDAPAILSSATAVTDDAPVILSSGTAVTDDAPVVLSGAAVVTNDSPPVFDSNNKEAATLVSQDGINTLTSSEAKSNLSLVGAGAAVTSTINKSSEEKVAATQTGSSTLDVKTTANSNNSNKDMVLDAAPSSSGNSLQSDGAKVASLDLVGQSSDKLKVPGVASAGLTAGVIDGTPVDTIKGKLLGGEQNSVAATSGGDAITTPIVTSSEMVESSGVGGKSIELELTGEKSAALDAKVSQSLRANHVVDQKGASDGGELDIAAGLAMIAGGAVSQKNKSMTTKDVTAGVNQNSPIAADSTVANSAVVASGAAVASNVSEESADLDWIMQQMSNDSRMTSETTLLSESAKQQIPITSAQVVGQNAEQSIKQLAPLSLGMATAESGLLDSKDADALVEVSGGSAAMTKLDAESLKQVEGGASVKAGLGDSTLASTAINPATQSGVSDIKLGLAVNANNNQNNMTMQVPPTHPNWSSEMGEKMMWMNKQGLQQAEIHLDPPELGSLTVKVTIDADVASVSFVAASAQVKDLLEGQVQRLREMMAQQGVELAEVDVNVSQQGSGSGQSEDDSDSQFARNGQEGDELDSELKPQEARVSKSKVDFYA